MLSSNSKIVFLWRALYLVNWLHQIREELLLYDLRFKLCCWWIWSTCKMDKINTCSYQTSIDIFSFVHLYLWIYVQSIHVHVSSVHIMYLCLKHLTYFQLASVHISVKLTETSWHNQTEKLWYIPILMCLNRTWKWSSFVFGWFM